MMNLAYATLKRHYRQRHLTCGSSVPVHTKHVQTHQRSEPFLAFRTHPVQSYILEKTGHSYIESNAGYVFNPRFGVI